MDKKANCLDHARRINASEDDREVWYLYRCGRAAQSKDKERVQKSDKVTRNLKSGTQRTNTRTEGMAGISFKCVEGWYQESPVFSTPFR